jgi:hypothetical protein
MNFITKIGRNFMRLGFNEDAERNHKGSEVNEASGIVRSKSAQV